MGHQEGKERAFTLTELLVVLGSLALLMTLALPLLASNRASSDRAVCQSNLRQIGRAYAMWADDHGGKFPQLTSSAEGGNNDNALCDRVWFQFYWVRMELGTPRILVCPSDVEKRPALDWSTSPNGGFNHVLQRGLSCSYVLSLGVVQAPHGLLSADRNVQWSHVGGCSAGPLYFGTAQLDWQSSTLGWTEKLHNKSGNIVLNDGSVLAAGLNELRTAVRNSLQPASTRLCTLYP